MSCLLAIEEASWTLWSCSCSLRSGHDCSTALSFDCRTQMLSPAKKCIHSPSPKSFFKMSRYRCFSHIQSRPTSIYWGRTKMHRNWAIQPLPFSLLLMCLMEGLAHEQELKRWKEMYFVGQSPDSMEGLARGYEQQRKLQKRQLATLPSALLLPNPIDHSILVHAQPIILHTWSLWHIATEFKPKSKISIEIKMWCPLDKAWRILELFYSKWLLTVNVFIVFI